MIDSFYISRNIDSSIAVVSVFVDIDTKYFVISLSCLLALCLSLCLSEAEYRFSIYQSGSLEGIYGRSACAISKITDFCGLNDGF